MPCEHGCRSQGASCPPSSIKAEIVPACRCKAASSTVKHQKYNAACMAAGVRQRAAPIMYGDRHLCLHAVAWAWLQMSGNELPPTFGTLLLTDVDRGIECYQVPNFESRTAHTYVPAPLAGIFGGGACALSGLPWFRMDSYILAPLTGALMGGRVCPCTCGIEQSCGKGLGFASSPM
eukprot:1157807-Pelagomonas_calceolata.AAC.6